MKFIFSRDGHSYAAKSTEDCKKVYIESQKRTLHFAEIANEFGCHLETVSIGSTPLLMHDFGVMEGITELRPGTYILMDAAQGNAIETYDRCAATSSHYGNQSAHRGARHYRCKCQGNHRTNEK